MSENKRHMDRVRALGCIVCGNAAVAHHIRTGVGMGRKASDFETIPLCPVHHTYGGYGVAIHAGRETWEASYGTEIELLGLTRLELGIMP